MVVMLASSVGANHTRPLPPSPWHGDVPAPGGSYSLFVNPITAPRVEGEIVVRRGRKLGIAEFGPPGAPRPPGSPPPPGPSAKPPSPPARPHRTPPSTYPDWPPRAGAVDAPSL